MLMCLLGATVKATKCRNEKERRDLVAHVAFFDIKIQAVRLVDMGHK